MKKPPKVRVLHLWVRGDQRRRYIQPVKTCTLLHFQIYWQLMILGGFRYKGKQVERVGEAKFDTKKAKRADELKPFLTAC